MRSSSLIVPVQGRQVNSVCRGWQGNWFSEHLLNSLTFSWQVWTLEYTNVRQLLRARAVYCLCLCTELRTFMITHALLACCGVYYSVGWKIEILWVWCQVVRHFFLLSLGASWLTSFWRATPAVAYDIISSPLTCPQSRILIRMRNCRQYTLLRTRLLCSFSS